MIHQNNNNILLINFMKGIYIYIHETKHVFRLYSFAAVQYSQFVLHVMLFRPWNIYCTFKSALPAVCVKCPKGFFFCISLISCFPDILLRYRLSDSEMDPVATIITGITFPFKFTHV